MRILLSNDDGIHAPGMAVLERIAATLSDDVWVVAPSKDASGTARSLTLTRPLRLQRFGERRWAVNGTPSDAVMMALAELMKDTPPDLILSGVNRGGNLAEDCFYSGTVAAAMEGALAGVPSVALSQVYRKGGGQDVSFACAEGWAERVLAPILAAPLAHRTLLNVNFPPLAPDAVRGIRVCAQGLRDYDRVRFDRREDPRGFPYYWLALGRVAHVPGIASDLDAIEDGFVSVTPLHLDLTHAPSLAALGQAYG
jgi:5'-nucleotidase